MFVPKLVKDRVGCCYLIAYRSSNWHMKMLADLAAKAGRKGEPMATPSIWLQYWT